MEKLYDRIDWHNNTSPALNETNLNRMSKAVDDIDDRVVDIAGTVMETVPQIQEDLAETQELLEDAEEISTHPPIIGQNGNWWVWDTSIDDYADSGVDAGVSVNVGTTTTLPAGSDATVTNSGTDTDPILNFGIPQGAAGQDGVSPEVTIGTITGGHSVTITDADHPAGQSFNVMDGADGAGVPTGGTTGQVLKKSSNTDYDTEWGTASSGGHTILNGSGSAMNQRGKLQFVGGNIKDDSTNDKTVVTVDREITQAEYDALSTAEQNNGTNYFITDAPSSYTGVPQSMIGDAWASGQSYAVGDYRIDGNVLYKCKTAHTSTASNRPPYASYWDAVSVTSQLGGADSMWDDIDSSLWHNMIVTSDRLPSGYIAKYAVVDKTAYIYICFHEIDKSKFGSGFDYWSMFRTYDNPNLPIAIRATPLIICDCQGVFTSAQIRPDTSYSQIEIVGTAQNYDNSKGAVYTTIIQGQYQIKQ